MDSYTRPDFGSVALITIDTQRDMLDGQPFGVPGTMAVLPQMGQLARLFRERAMPIVHIVRLYPRKTMDAELCRRAAVEAGSAPFCPGAPGSQLAAELLPEPNILLEPKLLLDGGIQRLGPAEVVIYKPRWGAFFRTPLESHLRALGVSTLVFTGCNYPNCPRTSIYEAGERDYRIVLVEDAISGMYPRGKEEMRNIGVVLMTTAELIEALDGINP